MYAQATDSTLPAIPDDITITQLLLDPHNLPHIRPRRPEGAPWLIDDVTGYSLGLEQVRFHSVILYDADSRDR
jgi:hypothetical protein